MRQLLLIVLLAALAVPAAAPAAELRVSSTLTFTRPDGTPVAYPLDFRVWCGRWAGDVRVRAIHVRVGTGLGTPVWWLSAVVADVRRRPVVRLPRSFIWDEPKGALLFATDGANELSSAEDEAAGRITIDRVRCGRRLALGVRVRATLGSEVGGEPLTVRGSIRARADL